MGRAGYERQEELLNRLPVPARFTDGGWPPIPVRARLVWESGEVLVDTIAEAWTGDAVLVEQLDPRSPFRGVWLPANDVVRRAGLQLPETLGHGHVLDVRRQPRSEEHTSELQAIMRN